MFHSRLCALLLFFGAFTHSVVSAQNPDLVVDELVRMGFENVSCTETDSERIFVLQNSAYRLESMGAVRAVDLIHRTGLPQGRDCRIVVLSNNVPQYSLIFRSSDQDDGLVDADSLSHRSRWETTYDLGGDWNVARKAKRSNRSLYKVDIVVYPQIQFRNLVIDQMYTFLINISPSVQVSLWNGMKLTAQIIFPIVNEYGWAYEQVRQGYVTLSQSLRIRDLFLTATVGTFNNFRWGLGLKARYVFSHFPSLTLEGEVDYSGVSYFDHFRWKVSDLKRLTYSIGPSYYWKKYNVSLSARFEQYLLSERGVKLEAVRHFKYTSIGLYAMKVQHAGNKGYNGGFRFQFFLPPKKYKRSGYIPRILPSKYMGLSYNAGNEQYYGRTFKTDIDSNIASDYSFNPIYIKSELTNY